MPKHALALAAVLLLAGEAAAQEPPPQGAPLERPSTVEGYERAERELKVSLREAEREDREREADGLRRDLDRLKDWRREDVERRSTGAFVGGIVMTAFGGIAILSGFGLLVGAAGADAGNADRDVVRGLEVASTVTLISGAGLVGGGIPLIVYGGERVMAADGAAGSARIVVGAGGARLEGTF